MEYNIITLLGHAELIDLVNQKMQKGWKPLGGVTFLNVPQARPQPAMVLGQAMVRNK